MGNILQYKQAHVLCVYILILFQFTHDTCDIWFNIRYSMYSLPGANVHHQEMTAKTAENLAHSQNSHATY